MIQAPRSRVEVYPQPMRSLVLVVSVLLPCSLSQKASAQTPNPNRWWVYFESRESTHGQPPRLILQTKAGKQLSLKASADTTLISYLETHAFPSMPRLAVGTRDKNRCLLKFALPALIQAKDLAKAELVLDLKLSKLAPKHPFSLGLYPVLSAWSERSVTWATQPRTQGKPLQQFQLPPKAQLLKVDLLPLVRSWLKKPASNHGLLIRQEGVPLSKKPSKKAIITQLRNLVGFLRKSDQALALARKQNKLVLTLVVSSQHPGAAGSMEQLLLSEAFCSSEILSLIKRSFVPLRQSYAPLFFLHHRGLEGQDPLAPLGTSVTKIKAPALLVSSEKGELRDMLQSIGTPSNELLREFLLRALGERAKGYGSVSKLPEATLSKAEEAQAKALRAAARLAWPERVAWGSGLGKLRPLGKSHSSERPVPLDKLSSLVNRSLVYLLDHQDPNGTWPVETAQYRMAISSFAAKALLLWEKGKKPALQKRIHAALARFEQCARKHLASADPREASSFGATYLLDYFLAAKEHAPTEANLGRLTEAARFLIAGQCPNGAWSYSYRFGTRWRGGFGGWPRTKRGRTHSINTGPALAFLLAARAAGAKIENKAIDRGLAILGKMRFAAGVFTYTYPDPISFKRSDQSIARGPSCELALYLAHKTSANDLLTALRRFMKLRAALRAPVKLDPSWSSPHNFSSYFFFYAYYHGALAWKTLEAQKAYRATAREALNLLRTDLLQVVELDGTWLDFEDLGKPYGTAAALLVLALAG